VSVLGRPASFFVRTAARTAARDSVAARSSPNVVRFIGEVGIRLGVRSRPKPGWCHGYRPRCGPSATLASVAFTHS
jgi:hypothetical protein